PGGSVHLSWLSTFDTTVYASESLHWAATASVPDRRTQDPTSNDGPLERVASQTIPSGTTSSSTAAQRTASSTRPLRICAVGGSAGPSRPPPPHPSVPPGWPAPVVGAAGGWAGAPKPGAGPPKP